MVRLDHQLLFAARKLFNGANVHRLKELIFAYEQAVDLHNRQAPNSTALADKYHRLEEHLAQWDQIRLYHRKKSDAA
jgi:hypothetical protein